MMEDWERDEEVDAVYIRLSQGRVVRTEDLGEGRFADYDATGTLVGVELLGVSHGVNLDGLPSHDVIERFLTEHSIRVYA